MLLGFLLLAGLLSANARSPWVKDVVVEKYGGKVEMHGRAGPVRSKPRSNSIYKYSPKKYREEQPSQVVPDYHEEKEHDPFSLITEMAKLNPSESIGRHPIQQEPLHREGYGSGGSRPVDTPVRSEHLLFKSRPQHEAYRPSQETSKPSYPSIPYKTVYQPSIKYGSSTVNEHYRPSPSSSYKPVPSPSYEPVSSHRKPSQTPSSAPKVKYGSADDAVKRPIYYPEQPSHYSEQPSQVKYGSSSEPSSYQPEQPSRYQPEEPSRYQPEEPSHYQPEEPSRYQPKEPSRYQLFEPSRYQPKEPTHYQPEEPTHYQPKEPSRYQPKEPSRYQPEEPSRYQPEEPSRYQLEELLSHTYESNVKYGSSEIEESYTEQPSHYPEQPSHYPEQPSHYPEQPSHYPEQPSHYPEQPSYFPDKQPPSSDRTGHSAGFMLYKKPEDKCHEYNSKVVDAIELLDAKNATCKEQYQQLRRNVDDRTIFDYCLEAVFIRDEVYGELDKTKKRDGKFFGLDFDLDFSLWGGDKDKDSNAVREEPWINDWNDDSWCRPNQFCRRCTRRGSCCRRYCARMFYDTDLDYYSCRPQYCDKYSSSSRCRKCRHCYCNERY